MVTKLKWREFLGWRRKKMNKSFYPTKDDKEVNWFFFDADGKILGKIATEIAVKLIGKEDSKYTPGVLSGNKVVVTNAEKVAVTGRKETQKVYYRHSDYPGGLKAERLEEVREKSPIRIIQRAVKGMLPQNKLTKKYMANLYIYPGAKHPHKAHEGK